MICEGRSTVPSAILGQPVRVAAMITYGGVCLSKHSLADGGIRDHYEIHERGGTRGFEGRKY